MAESAKDLANEKHQIEALRRYFVNRDDTYAAQNPDGSYYRVEAPLTDDVLLSHIKGDITVGVYQIEPENNTVKWLCFDVDSKEMAEVEKLRDSIVESGFCEEDNILVEDTGGRGYHLWIFFDPPTPALVAYYVGRRFEQQSKVKCEVFPKQRVVEAFGNLVKLPLGVHRETGQRSRFIGVSSLDEVARVSVPEEEITKAVQEAQRRESGWMERTASKGRGHSGEDPPCVRFWFSGVDPGNRNNVAIRLASYYRNFAKLDLDTTLARMMEWNARNAEPLPRSEITSIVGSADKGGYNYSCEDEFWKAGCNIEACPLKIREFPVAIGQVSDDVNRRVDELIAKGPIAFVQFLQQCLEYKMTGEWKNRLFLTKRFASVIHRTSMTRISAQSAAGKSWMLRIAEPILGEGRVVRLSSSTLSAFRRKLWKGFDPKNKLFILHEERAEEEDKGPTIKLQFELTYSEDSVKFQWSEPDEHGSWEPVEVELKGPLGFVTTSTEEEMSAHAETREATIAVDESREQDNLIHWWKRWRKEVPPKELEREEKEFEVLRGYFARLRPWKRIIIPFLDYIRFEYFKVFDRRKEDEFLGWIEDAAILFQPWLPREYEFDTLYALPFIFDFVSIISDEIIAQTRGELKESERVVLNVLLKNKDNPSLFRYGASGRVTKIKGLGTSERYDEEPIAFRSDELAKLSEFSRWTKPYVRNLLNSLARKGYLQTHGTTRDRVFSLVEKGDARNESGVSRLIPSLRSISGEIPIRTSEGFLRELREYAEHATGREIQRALLDNENVRIEMKPEDCLFQPEWPESRELIRTLGKSTKAPLPEGEKTAKITEKEPRELQWSDFSLMIRLLEGRKVSGGRARLGDESHTVNLDQDGRIVIEFARPINLTWAMVFFGNVKGVRLMGKGSKATGVVFEDITALKFFHSVNRWPDRIEEVLKIVQDLKG